MMGPYTFYPLRFREYRCLLPHEWESARVHTALIFAKVSCGTATAILIFGITTGSDLVYGLMASAFAAALVCRWLWLKRRLANFMRGSGLA